jgi:hypothetical protein
MNRWITRLTFLVILSVALARSASASPIEIELISSGATTVTVIDNMTGDANSAPGTITYFNSNFNGWNISFVSGTSLSPGTTPFALDLAALVMPVLPASPPLMPLTILVSDTGFTDPSPLLTTFSATIGGSGNGSATESAYIGSGIFAETTLIGTVGPLTTAGFSGGTATTGAAGSPPYSLTLQEVLTDTSGVLSFSTDGDIAPTPELPAMLLFGTGLLAIGGIIRRKTAS